MRPWRSLFAILICLFVGIPARPAVLVRISDEEMVHSFVEVSDEIWFATSSGVFRIRSGSFPELIVKIPVTATAVIAGVNGRVWVGTDEGVFEIEGDELVPILTEEHWEQIGKGPLAITAILKTDGAVWLGSYRGLYRFADGSVNLVLPQVIRALKEIDNTLWVGADSNAFQIIGDGDPVRVLPEDSWSVADIFEARGDIWLTTLLGGTLYGPCFRWSSGTSKAEAIGKGVISVAEIHGEVWLGTTRGAFRYRPDGDLEGPVGGIDKTINTLADLRERVWLGTTLDGVFSSRDAMSFKSLTEGVRLAVRGIVEVDNHVWLRTDTGVYRFDEDVDLIVRPLSTFSVPGLDLNVMVGDKVRIEAAYDRDGTDPYRDRIASYLRGVVRYSAEAVEKTPLDVYQPVDKVEEPVPTGFNHVHVRVRDSFGNVATLDPPQTLLVLPATSLPVTLVLYWLLWLTILLMAPHFDWAMTVITQSWPRKSGSLGVVFTAMLFVKVRRYLLTGYNVRLSRRGGAIGLLTPEQLLGRPGNKILVAGERSAVQSALESVAWQIARQNTGWWSARYFPVSLPLPSFTSKEGALSEGIAEELATTRKISDPTLAEEFLRRGDFVFLLDGLEKLDERQVEELRRFIYLRSLNNVVVVGSADSTDSATCRLLMDDDGFEATSLTSTPSGRRGGS